MLLYEIKNTHPVDTHPYKETVLGELNVSSNGLWNENSLLIEYYIYNYMKAITSFSHYTCAFISISPARLSFVYTPN